MRNASFVFVRRVSGNSGYDMDRMRTREIPGSGRNCIKKNWSMLNTHGAWRHPLYVRKKVIAICQDHVDETVVHVLGEIMMECVLKLVRGLYPNLPDTPYLGHKWC